MKRMLYLAALMIALTGLSISAHSPAMAADGWDCKRASDTFDTFDPSRWQEVLLYSMGESSVHVENGALWLAAHSGEPSEIQVYSLFTLSGDFDIRLSFDLIKPKIRPECRYNTGLVLQTRGEERAFKCYVSIKPGQPPIFRSRLDNGEESNMEHKKRSGAPYAGWIRVVRKDGVLTYLSRTDGRWNTVHTFKEACAEPLRVRFKLQTGDSDEIEGGCPAVVRLDEFTVKECTEVIPD